MRTRRPMSSTRAGHDSHCVSLQSIADVLCSFLADLIVGQVELCECLHESDDEVSSVRAMAAEMGKSLNFQVTSQTSHFLFFQVARGQVVHFQITSVAFLVKSQVL